MKEETGISVVDAIDKFMREFVVPDGTTAEELASQMYCHQMKIYAAHAGPAWAEYIFRLDLSFEELSAETQAGWLRVAKKKLAGELT